MLTSHENVKLITINCQKHVMKFQSITSLLSVVILTHTLLKRMHHTHSMSNGTFLLEHANESNMIITNTQRRKKKGKLWTYMSDMNGRKSQIDYILVNRKWKNSVHNVEAYSSFSSLGGDHRLVTATIHLSLRKSKTSPAKGKYNWSSLMRPYKINTP